MTNLTTKDDIKKLEWDDDIISIHTKEGVHEFPVQEFADIHLQINIDDKGHIHEFRPVDLGKYGIESESTGSIHWKEWWDEEGDEDEVVKYFLKNQESIDCHEV